ncbi:Uu.00g008380.m01.CDS01 [Anthostomella pinea]|uniref:Uu.00g008380.m01.CDS01 n=1 Tax=Anthostomella pinea TaxID=933095 RepID=A0AAI8VXV0_9PEZI|nr:Uu.00g008380.m01.CDS01 [Anthostomella pinea]
MSLAGLLAVWARRGVRRGFDFGGGRVPPTGRSRLLWYPLSEATNAFRCLVPNGPWSHAGD